MNLVCHVIKDRLVVLISQNEFFLGFEFLSMLKVFKETVLYLHNEVKAVTLLDPSNYINYVL